MYLFSKILNFAWIMQNSKILIDFCKGNLKSLYSSMYRPLMLYASRCLTVNFSFLAEDCVQDAIYKAYQSRHSFKTFGSLRSYLYTAVHNRSIDILRRSSAQERYLVDHTIFSDDVFTDIIEQETMNRLFEAVDNLEEKDRTLFFLYWEGHKTAEIAQMLDLAEITVKQRKARMVARLQKLISENGVMVLAMAILSEPLI